MFPERVVRDALEHARREYPRESCGLVVRTDVPHESPLYLPCANQAAGEGDFRMSPADLAAAMDKFQLLAVVHSHPNGRARPSEADRVMMARWGLPWLIVGWPTGEHAVLEPPGRGEHVPPLEGRSFSHGVLDCYALVRDYYHLRLGISLPNYHREDDWWLRGGNLYLDNFADAGFAAVEDGPREHDVLIMQIAGAPVPNHAGVFLGDTRFIHHLDKRLSRVDLWTESWRRRTVRVVRHKDLC